MLTSPIQKILEELHGKLRSKSDGEIADYIPELSKANPDWFGICLATADGQVYEVGDTSRKFTIQSISKPFVYGVALEDNGTEAVLKKIWMEPSGEAFNAISLREGTGQPENPMINAGAITATSMAEGRSVEQKVHRILDAMSRYAGRQLDIDQTVYSSESSTGHRNRAIAHMLRNFNIIEEDPIPSLEAYFMQCSISVNCRDLGIMAATLANGGINPITGTRAVVGDYIENILSVMSSCGMYDAAGEWIYNVGMPAKSGVSGGIVAILPGQLGIGVFSPLLDSHGNSVRGIDVCREISAKFNLHMFHVPRLAKSVLRRSSNLSKLHSNRIRSSKESESLQVSGSKVVVLELQGDLMFASAEVAVREFANAPDAVTELILDFGYVTALDYSAGTILATAMISWMGLGRRIRLARTGHLPAVAKILRKQLGDHWHQIAVCADQDSALEAAENCLLDEGHMLKPGNTRVELSECEMLVGMTPAHLELLSEKLIPASHMAGAVILEAGDDAGGMYFIMKGKASVWIEVDEHREQRLATFSAGMTFGEMALLDKAKRSASVRADTEIELLELEAEFFQELAVSAPEMHALLLSNLSRMLSRRLREANEKLSAAYA